MSKQGKPMIGILALTVVLATFWGTIAIVNGASPKQEAVSAEEQYAAAGGSMLYIRCFYASGGLKTTGSGFIIKSDGLVLTAAHVIDKAARVTATDPSGKELECVVVNSDMASDVAVIRLPRGSYKALQLADSAAAGGATIRAMGYPLKDTLVITEGLVSSPKGVINEKQRMLASCNILNGMSGGPIFDRYGRVVGLCSGSVRTMSGIHLSAMWSDICSAVETAQSSN